MLTSSIEQPSPLQPTPTQGGTNLGDNALGWLHFILGREEEARWGGDQPHTRLRAALVDTLGPVILQTGLGGCARLCLCP